MIGRFISATRCAQLFAIVAALLLPFAIVGAAPVNAATAGCTNASGVSVVVDLRQLGGGILERCASGLGSGANGLDALQAAGIPYQGTSQWGDGFICRLLGRPAADESLRIPGNSNYHEQCISTPPASAYWAYWWAPNGGPWQYSSAGASSHHITPGGFEGWVFTLGDANQQTAPGVAPVRATADPTPATGASKTAPSQATNADPAHSATNAARPSNSIAAHQPTSGHSAASTSPGGAANSPSSATSSASSAGAGAADTGVSSSITAVGGRTPTASHGISTGTIIGACLLAFLVTIGGGTAWRQARARRQS